MIKRELYMNVWRELSAAKSMVFLTGPRQTGKTTLAEAIGHDFANRVYFNWDFPESKALLTSQPTFFEQVKRKDASVPLVVLDEIHKYKDWKNYLKGIYDKFHREYRFLVSGSGRLDIYQRGGDSLAGRYHLFHLWPFTLAELGGKRLTMDAFLKDPLAVSADCKKENRQIWDNLCEFSGFPEPYLSGKETAWRRWSNGYTRQLIREDIRDLAGLQAVDTVETLYALLPGRVGSLLSLNTLATDLRVSHNTVKAWLDAFERFFLIFRIEPWTHQIRRGIQKEKKLYLFNLPLVQDQGSRFENAVALELFRAVSNWNDLGLGPFSLHFVRNKEKQEVDFLLARARKPILLVEAKLSDEHPSAALIKYQQALSVPAVQVTGQSQGYKIIRNGAHKILVTPVWQWASALP
jgi:predicted AAA+ superfamily ATPase